MSVWLIHTAGAQMASMVMLDLMGGVALLLWGLHMVRSGIIRAFGSDLRRMLGFALRNRFVALLAGHETVSKREPQHAPQVAAKRADDAAADHVKAPEQEGNAAHQIEHHHACHLRTGRVDQPN